MASERKLTVVLAGDAKGLTSTIDKAEGKIGGFGSKLGGLSGKAKVAMAGGVAAVAGFASSSVDAFVEAESAQARLTDAFAKFPQLAGGNIDKLRELNSALAKKTRFDDDATASSQAVLAQFGLTADEIAKATPLLQDYAAKTGKDLPSAAEDFGKAILGQGRAFKGIGLELGDTGTAAGNFEQLMGGLSDKVGGFAQKEGKTAAGQAEILKNQFGELQETVGSKLVPALLKIAGFITGKVIPAFEKVGGFIAENKELFIALGIGITAALVPAFIAWAAAAGSAAVATVAAAAPVIAIGAAIAALVAGLIYAYQNWNWFRDAVDKVAAFFTDTLWPVLQNVAGWITGTLIPTIGSIIGTFIEWGKKVGEVAGKIIGYVAGVIGWVKQNWPLILAILTGPIGLAVLAITKNWDTIKAGVTGVKDWIVARFNDVVGFFANIPGRFAYVLSGVADTVKSPFKRAFNAIADLWNSTVGRLSFKVPGWVPGIGGKGWDVPDIPTFASGVRNFRGGLAIVGERGPELVNLPAGSDVIPNRAIAGPVGSGFAPVPVVIELDGQVLGRAMIRFDADHRARNGRPAFGAA